MWKAFLRRQMYHMFEPEFLDRLVETAAADGTHHIVFHI
jgi:hypothetical protein